MYNVLMRIKQILKTVAKDQKIAIKGWVRTCRDSKANAFIAINDGSCMSNLQVFVDKEIVSDESILTRITTGASIEVRGTLVESPGQGQSVEVRADEIIIIGDCPDDYPLQKKRHTNEFLREIGHLRGRTNTYGAVIRVRSAMSFAIHKFYQERGFVNLHTPIITASDAEGAGEMFQVTTLPFHTFNSKAGIDYSRDFFGKKASLTVSGQLSAETYATAVGDVYTFGPTFRAENSNTTRHLAEFWMVEPEMAFCDIYGDMDLAEEFLKYILKYVLENCGEDMEFFDKWVNKGILTQLNSVVNSDFARVTYTEAIEKLMESGKKFEFAVTWGIDLASEHERYLSEDVYKRPVIVYNYPKEIKAFYMKLNDDGKTVRAMDVLAPGIGEIIGGSEREDSYDTLVKRIEELGLIKEDYSWYLDLIKFTGSSSLEKIFTYCIIALFIIIDICHIFQNYRVSSFLQT
jgi:asparaginyl-tRNA synthetase